MSETNGHVTPRHAAQAVRALAWSRALIGVIKPVRVVSNHLAAVDCNRRKSQLQSRADHAQTWNRPSQGFGAS